MGYIYEKLSYPFVWMQAGLFYFKMKKLDDPKGERIVHIGSSEQIIRILVVGDSSALGVGCDDISQSSVGVIAEKLSEQFSVQYQVCAFTGFTTKQIFEKVREVPKQSFDFIVISLGTNDILQRTKLSAWIKQITELMTHLQVSFYPQKIFINAVPPFQKLSHLPSSFRTYLSNKSQQMNQYLSQLSVGSSAYQFVDMDFDFHADYISDDGFHPSALLYQLQGERIATLMLEKLVGENDVA